MAYDPTIPDLDHYIEDDIPAIRANFAELEPLVPHVATLVDLTALQPHIAEILNSRIVDHNLDVANPPNGWYIRWANGLQMCFHRTGESGTTGTQGPFFTSPAITWTFPAEFSVIPPGVYGGVERTSGSGTGVGLIVYFGSSSTTQAAGFNIASTNNQFAGRAVLIAIGRWS